MMDLVIRHELHRSVREHSHQRRRVALEQPSHPAISVYDPSGFVCSTPCPYTHCLR